MASSSLGGARVSKGEITDKGTDGDGQHDPAVVRHKQEHDEEGVKDLDGVEGGLDDFAFLLRLRRVPS